MIELLEYENEWGEPVKVYKENLDYGMKITWSKKNRCDMFLIPKDKEEEFLKLMNTETNK